MSRPKEDGLKWFPLIVGFFKDRRIRRLIMRFGADGPLFYIYILCCAYESGYCVRCNDDFIEDSAIDLGCSTEKIGLMLHYLLDKSLLDSTLFNTVKVLSSHGIQAQYQESKKGLRRDVEVDSDSWILEKSETEEFIKVRFHENKYSGNHDKSRINTDKSEIYGIKEKKRKESKKNKINGDSPGEKLSAFDVFWNAYPKKMNKLDAQKAFTKVKVPLQTLLDAIERQKRSAQWREDGGRYIPYPATWLRGGAWENIANEKEEQGNGNAWMKKFIEERDKMAEP